MNGERSVAPSFGGHIEWCDSGSRRSSLPGSVEVQNETGALGHGSSRRNDLDRAVGVNSASIGKSGTGDGRLSACDTEIGKENAPTISGEGVLGEQLFSHARLSRPGAAVAAVAAGSGRPPWLV